MPGGDGLCATAVWGQHCSQWAGVCTDGSENEGCQDFGSGCSPCYRGLFGPGQILDVAVVVSDTLVEDRYTIFKRGCLITQPGNLAVYGVEEYDCIISINGREATPEGIRDITRRCHKDIAVDLTFWSAANKEIRTVQVL